MSHALPIDQPWRPELDWDTPAGRVLSALMAGLTASGGEWLVNVFGSAPLQMAYARDFISADVDTSVVWTKEAEFERIIRDSRLDRGVAEIYVQCCKEAAFRTSPRWKDRAFLHTSGGVTLRFAHPIDILIGKLNRLEEKDMKAFHLVKAVTGEPMEETMLRELREAPDLFSHAYMAPHGSSSYAQMVERFWSLFYQREIDVEREIIGPAREALLRDYDAGADGKSDLRGIARRGREAAVVAKPRAGESGV